MLPAPVSEQERQQRLGLSSRLVRLYQPSQDLLAPLLGILFLIGGLAIILRPRWRPALPLPMLVVAVVLLSAFLDGPVPRFRYPLDPLIAPVAAGGFVALVSLLARSRRYLAPTLTPPPSLGEGRGEGASSDARSRVSSGTITTSAESIKTERASLE
jgi:hypothetical protein